jgi:hypothetical protein
MKFLEDLLPSYRGAGVIGTCLAFFVLASMVCLSLFAFDPGLNGMWESTGALVARQEREIAHLNRQVEEMQVKYDTYRNTKQFRDAVRANMIRQDALDLRLKDVGERIEGVAASLAEMQSRHETYASAYRKQVRGHAKGEILPTIVTRDGRTLESPQVVEVNPAGIQLRYANGVVRVSAKELPDEMWERFQFDDAEMEAHLDQEETTADNYEKGVERVLAEEKENLRKERLDSRKQRIERLEGQIRVLKDRIRVASRQYASLRGNPYRNYRTLTMLIRQVDIDEKTLRKAELELARLKTRDVN